MDSHGQVTLELVVSTTVVAVLLSCASFVLKAEWDRGRCAYTVFEVTHGEMTGESEGPDSGPPGASDIPVTGLNPLSLKLSRATTPVAVTPSGTGVSGTGTCGQAEESVSFKWLEAM